MTQLAWHYTRQDKLAAIVRDGTLRAHTYKTFDVLGAPAGERPVLWFTLNQFIEPTLSPLCVFRPDMDRGDAERKAAIEQHVVKHDLWQWARIGYPAMLLFPLGLTVTRPMSERQRAVVDDWRVSYQDIATDDCVAVEIMNHRLEWQRVWTKPPTNWMALLHRDMNAITRGVQSA